jgi:ribosome-binding protein aMBF1 (putative translation factor)
MKKRVIGKVDGMEIFTYNPQKEHAKIWRTHSSENIKRKKNKVWTDSETPKKFFKEVMKNKEAQRAYREEEMMINLVVAIKREMAKKHLTNKTLANKVGLKYKVVTDFLNGHYNIQIGSLFDIAYALGKKLIVKLV